MCRNTNSQHMSWEFIIEHVHPNPIWIGQLFPDTEFFDQLTITCEVMFLHVIQ